MNRFWELITQPILMKANAKKIVEIGAEYGLGTKKILEYVVAQKGTLTSIDPFPLFDTDQWMADYSPHYSVIKGYSLEVLSSIADYDAILIDGDHNWYTVYHELQLIEKNFKDKAFPILFLHDISWPYGRRDLYYNPQNIPAEFRHPYAKKGMLPGQNELADQAGINYDLNNALEEGTPKNGVLTAVEDFIEASDRELTLITLPAFHGFGILVEKQHAELIEYIQQLIANPQLLELTEKERIGLLLSNCHYQVVNAQLQENIRHLKKKIDQSPTCLKWLAHICSLFRR